MDNPHDSSELPQFLVDAGLLSAEKVKEVLEKCNDDGERLAVRFVNCGLVADAKLAQVLSYQLCLPWVSLEHVRFSPKLLRMIPADIALRFGVMPVHVRRRTTDGRMTLYVATDDPTNKLAETVCSEASGLPVRMMVATPTDIDRALREEYGDSTCSSTTEAQMADTSPQGQRLSRVEPATSKEQTPAANPPSPRSHPDTDVAAAAARMSSPDLSEYVNSPAPPRITGSSPPNPDAATSPIPPGPALSADASPNMGTERSPIPGLAAAAKVSPRIVAAKTDENDADIEELEEVEEEHLPSTRRAAPAAKAAEHAEQQAEEDAARQAPAEQQALNTAEAEPADDAVQGEVFDEASWEMDAPSEEPSEPGNFAPPPPPRPKVVVGPATVPPPPGAIPPPPPPPTTSERAAGADIPKPEPEELEPEPPEELEPEPPEIDPEPASSPSPDAIPEPTPTPRSKLDEEVVLVVGADDEFAYHCARALGDAPARIVRCTLMSAMPKAKQLCPFALIVPHEMYAFDRFAFNKLALEADSPLIVWEAEYEPEQIAMLLSIARRRVGKPEG